MSTEKKYNARLAFVSATKGGNLISSKINSKTYNEVIDAIEEGGKIFVRKLSEETREKLRENSKYDNEPPTHVVEFMSAASVEEYASNRENGL